MLHGIRSGIGFSQKPDRRRMAESIMGKAAVLYFWIFFNPVLLESLYFLYFENFFPPFTYCL